MSSKKEEKSQAAADKIKAATLTAAKGLSRAQAERAATAAARNVNAYGQKEEGPSRWQERKEAKRQMYLMSTEKAVRLGERKTTSAAMGGGVASQCQKCFQTGHWTYECKNERVYISRPSRSQQLKNPKLRQKLMTSYEMDNPDIQDDENVEKKDDEKAGKKKKKSKRKYREDSKSGSDSEASVFDSDSRSGSSSVTGSDSNSSSDSSSSDSEEDRRRRKKRKQKKTVRRSRSKKYASSSEDDSEDGSDSDSDSDDRPSRRKKSRRHSRRR